MFGDDHVLMDRDEPDECRCGCPNCNSGNHAYCPMQCDGGGTPDEGPDPDDGGVEDVEINSLPGDQPWLDGTYSPVLETYDAD